MICPNADSDCYLRNIILELAARVFSPRDNDNTESWSSVFMLQQGLAREKQIRELLGEAKEMMKTFEHFYKVKQSIFIFRQFE